MRSSMTSPKTGAGGSGSRPTGAGGPVCWTIRGKIWRPAHSNQRAPGASRKFVSFRLSASADSNQVNALLFDADDNLWRVTDDGLYRAPAGAIGDLQFKLVLSRSPMVGPVGRSGTTAAVSFPPSLPETGTAWKICATAPRNWEAKSGLFLRRTREATSC